MNTIIAAYFILLLGFVGYDDETKQPNLLPHVWLFVCLFGLSQLGFI
jgi:hypothetical protein